MKQNNKESSPNFRQNAQAQPPAPAGDKLAPSGETQESPKTLPAQEAGGGCAAAPCSASGDDSIYIAIVDKNNVEVTNGFTFFAKNIPTKYVGHTVAQFLQELFEKGYLKEELKASATPQDSLSETPSV